MSVPKGHEADLDALLTDFLARHGGTASFDSFRHCWQRSHFSCIHEARPLASAVEQYTQALFATALARLGCSPAAEAGAVDANDAGVLYALLLLFWTQRCSPRVHIYLPLSKVARLQRLISQAVQVEHADILRVFRVLLTEAALVPGCVTPSELQAAFSQRPAAAATCSAVVQAAEEHLLSGLYGALACDSLAGLAAQYAAAAGACNVQHSEAPLQQALHACLDALETGKRELRPCADSEQLWGGALTLDAQPGGVGPTASAVASKSAALPLRQRSESGRANIDAQLERLAAGAAEACEREADAQMPFVPGED